VFFINKLRCSFMKNVIVLSIAVGVLFGVLHPQLLLAQTFTNGQDADFVIGQPDFTSNTANNGGIGAQSLVLASAVAVDVVNNKLYVADGNHRVLRYALPINSNQPIAEAVLGQTDFVSNTNTTTQNGMNRPLGLAVGAGGRLWVADGFNNRILRFDAAHTKSNGSNADGVLGQADFVSNGHGTAANQLRTPRGLHEDSNGSLWVADFDNRRVLKFSNAVSKSNGAAADIVLGQTGFGLSNAGTTRSSTNGPLDVVVDGSGNLWVADYGNHRVLRFDNATSKTSGANADGVLGQPDFTSSASATTQSGMFLPLGVSIDSDGNLYVVEFLNRRVIIFSDAASKADGANADIVLGAADFTTIGSIAPLQNSLGGFFHTFPGPSIEFAGGVLYVASSLSSRVLVFGVPVVATIPTVGEWSMIVLTLSLFCVAVMYVRKPAFAMIGQPQGLPVQNMLLGKEDFVFSTKWFFALSLVVSIVVWSVCVYFHETAVRDMIGTGVTGIVGGYLLMLLAVWATEKR
jgi:sugar lactone lactonase YvrE